MKTLNNITLEDYFKQEYPEIIEEYIRATTSFYYEPDVLYHPVTNGFGCSSGGSKQPFKIVNANYCRNGEMYITVKPVNEDSIACIMTKSIAHKQMKRFDDVAPIGKSIPNSKKLLYLNYEGIDYNISQYYWRTYDKNTLAGRIIISINGDITGAYHELYCNFGSSWNYKHMKGYDSVKREQYDIKFNVSVRQFKQYVFGNPDVKLKCQLFGHL